MHEGQNDSEIPEEYYGESPLCTPKRRPVGIRELREGKAGSEAKGPDVKRKKRKKRRRVVINTSYCKYDIVRKVAADMEWVEDPNEDGEKGDFNLFWTDSSVAIYRVMKLQNWQRINHFPSMHIIARKVQLSNTLAKMRKAFPLQYSFTPKTWSLRSERNQFRKYALSLQQKKTFIVKPSAGSQGKGIFLTQDPQDLSDDMEDAVIQEYITRPLLIEDKKFDLRCYALVTSMKYPSIFMFNDGLVRLCTVDYQKPGEDNLHELQMHLTNYAINRTSEHFVFNDNAEAGDVGHKRDFAFFNKWLESEGHDPAKVWSRIDKVIVKTLLAAQPMLSHVYTSCLPHNNDGYTCFEILGFDMLLDQSLRPWLLEVNHSPSFNSYTPLDDRIKSSLISEVVRILNIKPDDRSREKERDKEEFRRRMESQARRAYSKKTGGDEADVREMEKEEAEAERQRQEELVKEKRKEEDTLLQNFRRVYPVPDPDRQQLYEEFIEAAKEVNAPSSTVATVQREQEGKKEREKHREKQEREEALRKGLLRPRSPSVKREEKKEKAKVSEPDTLKTEQWQQKLDREMERHKRRISLGPRLSVFQLRDQYMTVPIGSPIFDAKESADQRETQVLPPASAYPLRVLDYPSQANILFHPDPPMHHPSKVSAPPPGKKEPISLTYVVAPCVAPIPKYATPGRNLRQVKVVL